MSEVFSFEAKAKTNLSLRVTGKRDDGFHEIATRMVTLSLSDRIDLEWTSDNQVSVTCSDPNIPTGEENLVVKAVRALESHLGKTFSIRIHIEKRIPSGAGLGGGSSDAAAVLRGMNQMGDLDLSNDELAKIASTFGSDNAFFIYDQPCDCTGRGEIIRPVNFDWELPVVLLKPAFEVGAGWAYQRFQESKEIPGIYYGEQICPWGTMINDLERPVFEKHLILARMKEWLLDQGEVHSAIMSGSGSTMLAILTRSDLGPGLIEKAKIFGDSLWSWTGRTEASR